jgi:hypothetical protein
MDTKLTLRLNKTVIEKAKDYAHIQNISLSKMIESYLESLTRKSAEATDISPLVESLSGVIQPDDHFDFRKDYTNYLTDKHQ